MHAFYCWHPAFPGISLVPDVLTCAGLPDIAGIPGVVSLPSLHFSYLVLLILLLLLASLLFDSVPADPGVPILSGTFTYCTVELDILGYWTMAIILLFFLQSDW